MSAVRFIVVMGVSGCGKSTVAALLAGRLGWEFVEGDALHPAANVEKMRLGIPLDDTDRAPWLQEVARTIRDWRVASKTGIIACSALRRCYREVIVGGADDVRFIYLRGKSPLIAERLAARQGHYMPASLLESQFATLEEPDPDEPVITIDTGASTGELVTEVLSTLHLAPDGYGQGSP
ncbi:MAG: gluconokinase [Acetobacter aceti]|uniref:Gluconokinase n=1 Tax=Acetobacter aceti TaxID=435 RepID=A0A1U9KDU0_ACEAC|nr:gluconokinase [Acetobacter aceti]AQS83952.1 carbohydrate kinase [Acetobacter aceti]